MKKKGSPKTGGRKAGTPNKTTGTIKEWIAEVVEKNRSQVEKDLKAMAPEKRVAMIERLVQYIIPKASTVNINFEQLNDQQLDQLIDEMINRID